MWFETDNWKVETGRLLSVETRETFVRPLSVYSFMRFLVFFLCTGLFSGKKSEFPFLRVLALDSWCFKAPALGLKQSLKSLNQHRAVSFKIRLKKLLRLLDRYPNLYIIISILYVLVGNSDTTLTGFLLLVPVGPLAFWSGFWAFGFKSRPEHQWALKFFFMAHYSFIHHHNISFFVKSFT